MGFLQTVVTVVATLSSLGNFLAAMPLLRGEHPGVSSVESKTIELQASPKELLYGVYSDYWPSFTYPTGGEQWEAGSEHIVRWNQTLPPHVTYSQVPQTADLVLGYWDKKAMQSGENLELKHPLVKNVSLYIHGQNLVKFRLPCTPHLKEKISERQYFFALIGSTRNLSPTFTITVPKSSHCSAANQEKPPSQAPLIEE